MSSKSQARRAIADKGLKINDILINDDKMLINLTNFKKKKSKISFGKKRHYLIKVI